MKTNDELERAIQNLIDRMNRVEAKVANAMPAAKHETGRTATDAAIELLGNAIAVHQRTAGELLAMSMDLRRAR